MIKLHHLENSRSVRILWVLEELGIEYELKTYKRLPSGLAPPELKAVDPLGHAPILEDDGHTVAESGAIIEYLVEKYGGGKYTSSDDAFWKHYIEGSLMPFCVFKLVLSKGIESIPWYLRSVLAVVPRAILSQWVDPNLNNAVEIVDKQLKGKQGWAVGGDVDGNPTIADFMLGFTIDVLAFGGRLEHVGEGIKSYAERLQSYPSYKKANNYKRLSKNQATIAIKPHYKAKKNRIKEIV
ncbi:thioredoxin-like protein [Wallemia mellicola]|uniref:glutathione transferase n=1 Tax=Wallemia mellicola TaxID=1708541 RepID=A0A4T0QHC5_9BASI|nr:thioredoxin-like protein [Wallemia mellicola]TIC24026.1 thioredoxin-like protein [Wallemia mellicola]TIC67072.1 thioredoxin-like protein [Wallemia mellicola]